MFCIWPDKSSQPLLITHDYLQKPASNICGRLSRMILDDDNQRIARGISRSQAEIPMIGRSAWPGQDWYAKFNPLALIA